LPKIIPDECQDDCDLGDVPASMTSWIGPLFPLGAASSGPFVFYLLNKIGRKNTICVASLPILAGYILLSLANGYDSIIMVFIGRFLVGKSDFKIKKKFYAIDVFLGVSSGAYVLVAPLYVGETAETSIRGALASFTQLMLSIGITFVDALNISQAVSWTNISWICVSIPGI
jgi:MFS family permease